MQNQEIVVFFFLCPYTQIHVENKMAEILNMNILGLINDWIKWIFGEKHVCCRNVHNQNLNINFVCCCCWWFDHSLNKSNCFLRIFFIGTCTNLNRIYCGYFIFWSLSCVVKWPPAGYITVITCFYDEFCTTSNFFFIFKNLVV